MYNPDTSHLPDLIPLEEPYVRPRPEPDPDEIYESKRDERILRKTEDELHHRQSP